MDLRLRRRTGGCRVAEAHLSGVDAQPEQARRIDGRQFEHGQRKDVERARAGLPRAPEHPRLTTAAVAADGTLYLAGIDAPHGLWVSSSDDNGQTFQPPQSVAPLLGNPSAGCAQT